MHLNSSEFREMKDRFHCTSVCDEQYLGPFDVDASENRGPWRIYVEGTRFREACDWIRRRREEAVIDRAPSIGVTRHQGALSTDMGKPLSIACAAFALFYIAMGWEHIWANPGAATPLVRLGWGYMVLALGLLPIVAFRALTRVRAVALNAVLQPQGSTRK